MERPAPPPSLDALAVEARIGDERAEASLYQTLRVRLLAVAKRRVREADAEDVVQDALRIVLTKYRDLAEDRGILVWSLTVLRHVIGNYYQAKRPGGRWVSLEAIPGAQALPVPGGFDGGLDGPEEFSAVVEKTAAALSVLTQTHPRCGAIFKAILESLNQGGGPRECSQRALEAVRRLEPALSPGGFYVALHRCRARLREILKEMEGGS